LKLQIKDQSILLMGDLEKEGENELLKYSPGLLQADILKAGHHGSNTSSQENFLDIVKSTEAIISCGQNNHYNHPSKETLEHFEDRNIHEFRTDEQGMIYYTWSMFSKKLSKGKYIKD
jgi:competence protein ComEC